MLVTFRPLNRPPAHGLKACFGIIVRVTPQQEAPLPKNHIKVELTYRYVVLLWPAKCRLRSTNHNYVCQGVYPCKVIKGKVVGTRALRYFYVTFKFLPEVKDTHVDLFFAV